MPSESKKRDQEWRKRNAEKKCRLRAAGSAKDVPPAPPSDDPDPEQVGSSPSLSDQVVSMPSATLKASAQPTSSAGGDPDPEQVGSSPPLSDQVVSMPSAIPKASAQPTSNADVPTALPQPTSNADVAPALPQPTSSAAQVVLTTQPPPSATLNAPPPHPTSSPPQVISPSATPNTPALQPTSSAAQVVLTTQLPPSATPNAPPPPPPADPDNPFDEEPLLSGCFSISNISLQVGGYALLQDASLDFQETRRYALVGPSGSGKSTLLRAIHNGDIKIREDMTVCYLADGIKESDLSVIETVLVYKPQEKSDLEKQIAKGHPEDDKEKLYRQLDKIGPEPHYRAHSILAGFGFDSHMLQRKTRSFSESWRIKIALAKALCSSPDILLLDNPNKFLDFEASAWLVDQLKNLNCIQVIVSNSERLLAVCTDIIEIDAQNKKLVEHCNTTHVDYLRQKNEFPSTSAQADDKFRFVNVAGAIPGVRNLVHWSGVSCVHNNMTIFKNLNLIVDLGSKIGLMGHPGKSCLLKYLARNLLGLQGSASSMPGIVIASFQQNSVGLLDEQSTGFQYMKSCNKTITIQEAYKSASNFDLSEEMINRKIEFLSDSQRTRLVFSAMAAKKPQLLLLDEPTSHLDWDEVDSLAEGLKKFDGAIVFAGHDYRLISLVANEIWISRNEEITPHGTFNIKDYKDIMIRNADNDRCFLRIPAPSGLFPLFSVGSYKNMALPFISYLKYIDDQNICSTEATVSLDRFMIRRHMTASAPCNSLEEGFLLIPGEVVTGKRYLVSTEYAKKVTSSMLKALWTLELVGLCFSDFTKDNIFVTPSGQVKFRGLQLLNFSEHCMKRNLSSARTILKDMFSSDGKKPPSDIKHLLKLMKRSPEKRALFHIHSSLVPLSVVWDLFMKLFGALYYTIEPTLRDQILENLPHLDTFEAEVQSNLLLKMYFDFNQGRNYITPRPAPALLVTPEQIKAYNRERARKLTLFLRNRQSHPMENFGILFRYLSDMASLAAYVRFCLVICYLQEKLFDAGETKNLMLHNYVN